MSSDIEQMIEALSRADKKTLSQKALKAVEELGELAGNILPYDNAYATRHRFAESTDLLEELADIYLTVKSMVYEIGHTHEQFEDMVRLKSAKWAEIQGRESKVKSEIPFEIHVTVKTDDISLFRDSCLIAGVKPIVLDLQDRQGGSILMDVMTSSVHMGNNGSSYKEMQRISKCMEDSGMPVVRKKIETVPWHPAAPSTDHSNPQMPPNCYFESHFNVTCDEQRLPSLRLVAEQCKCHISKSIFKRVSETEFKIMLTYREYAGVYEYFKLHVDDIAGMIQFNGFQVDKPIVEFSIFDTKVSHDASWISK